MTITLSPAITQAIDHWVAKFPKGRQLSAVLQALMIVQEHHGHLSLPLMQAVAHYLEVEPMAVYEVATFYDRYHLKPVGRHVVSVCTNVSCMLRGSDRIVEHLEQKLGIALGGTTEDGRITLREVECMAACGGAPMLEVDKVYHEDLTPEKVDRILETLT